MATMSLQAAYDRARGYLETSAVDQAIGLAQHILEHFPENLEAHRILGEAYLASRQFDQAEAAFSRVLHADPENIPAHVGLGITYERQNRLEQAVAEFEQALEVRPDMPELRSQLLRLYTDIWGSEGATLRLSRPGLARLYAKGHMLPQAIQEFRSVIDELPDRFDARIGLAEALWRDGQEELAAETCEEILAERPDALKANLLLGYIKLAGGDESGESFWRMAQQLDPYQQVARAMFEVLPDIPPPGLDIPEWDEAAWRRARERDEAERQAQPALSAAAAGAGAAAAAASTDQDLFDSWLDDELAPPTEAPPASAPLAEDDDFLASLLALETPPIPSGVGVDLDSSSGVTPFSFDEEPPASPAEAPAEASAGAAELFDWSAEAPAEASAGAAEPFDWSAEAPAETPAGAAEPFDWSAEAPAEASAGAAEPFDWSAEAPAEAAFDAPAAGADEEALAPLSLADLGLSEEEIASLSGEPPASLEAAPEAPAAPAEDVDLFDWASDMDGGPASPAPAASEAAAPSELEEALTPFSLEELGLSAEEIAALGGEEPAPLEPAALDWSAEPGQPAGPQDEIEADLDLGDLAPFSLDDLDLSAADSGDVIGSLPPSLRPFSLEDGPAGPAAPAGGLPPIDAEDHDEHGGYSWQQPSARGSTDFLRSESQPQSDSSIFAKLRQQASERPPLDEEPLAPISDDDAAAGYFSDNDDHSPLAEDVGAGAERFAGGFRLPREESAAEEPAPAAAAAEPELTPFSLEELGLSPEEIAALEGAGAAEEPAAAEPELTPFSLEELGLSPEEIAALEGAGEPSASELARDLPAMTGETIVPGWSPGEEPALTPFGGEDSASEVPGDVEPFSFEGFDLEGDLPGQPAAAPPTTELDLDSDVAPFSLDDLGLDEEYGGPGGSDRELGLSPEELAGLDLGELETIIGESPAPSRALPTSSDPLERLMLLGQEQGYVDLTDIIGVVEDPEAEAERIEEIGWALHRAGIEIRDGDEVIDMEEVEEAEEPAAAPAAAVAPAIDVLTPGVEADLTPFSFEELGLSPEEIAALGLDQGEAAPAAPAPAAAAAEPELTPFSLEELGLSPEEIAALEGAGAAEEPAAAAEPELTPFSLEELGLSPEEVAALESASSSETVSAPEPAAEEPALEPFSLEELGLSPEEIAMLNASAAPAPEPAAEEPALEPFSLEELGLSPEEIAGLGLEVESAAPEPDDPFDFSAGAEQPVERVTRRSEPRVEEPPPPAAPEDLAFTPAPLDALDDIWELSTPPPPEAAVAAAAAATPPPPAARKSEPARVVLPPREERARPAPRREARQEAPQDRVVEAFARRGGGSSWSRDDALYARREAVARGGERAVTRSAVGRDFGDFIPTGDDNLDEYLGQLAAEPGNVGLALAVGRLCAQSGRGELMALAFRRVLRAGQEIDQLAENLEELIETVDDASVQRQIARLLGDVYTRQGRLREAMAAYNQTFAR